MFDELTGRGHRVLLLAGEEARRLSHEHIGTEHLLLALMADESSSAAQALHRTGVADGPVRAALAGAPLSPVPPEELEAVVGLAGEEAGRRGHAYAGPEHLLLGVLRLGHARVVEARTRLGVDADRVETQLLALMAAG